MTDRINLTRQNIQLCIFTLKIADQQITDYQSSILFLDKDYIPSLLPELLECSLLCTSVACQLYRYNGRRHVRCSHTFRVKLINAGAGGGGGTFHVPRQAYMPKTGEWMSGRGRRSYSSGV